MRVSRQIRHALNRLSIRVHNINRTDNKTVDIITIRARIAVSLTRLRITKEAVGRVRIRKPVICTVLTNQRHTRLNQNQIRCIGRGRITPIGRRRPTICKRHQGLDYIIILVTVTRTITVNSKIIYPKTLVLTTVRLKTPVLAILIMRNLKIKLDRRRTLYKGLRMWPARIQNIERRAT